MPNIRVFQGKKYYEYNGACAGYFRNRRGKLLHRAIYEAAHGPIESRIHVHHRDGDRSNNDLANLEALDIRDHMRLHMAERPDVPGHMARIRPLTVLWHRSPEGRAWHSEHSREAFAKRGSVDYTCQHCGGAYRSRHRGRARFCSNACRTGSRYQSGVDDEDRNCSECGTVFRCNRYKRKKTCSRACHGRAQSRTKASLRSHG